jgi:high-affinity Fe2+/Pb2+ permease
MKLLAYLTELFIGTFGITRPKPEQQRVTNLVIGGFLLAFCVVVLGVIGFLVFEISTGNHGH